jgi:hypothetical protein
VALGARAAALLFAIAFAGCGDTPEPPGRFELRASLARDPRGQERAPAVTVERFDDEIHTTTSVRQRVGQPLAWPLRVPPREDEPELRFGVRLVTDAEPVRARLSVEDGMGGSTPLWESMLEPREGVRLARARVALGEHAGRSVRLVFEAEGDGGGEIAWRHIWSRARPTRGPRSSSSA